MEGNGMFWWVLVCFGMAKCVAASNIVAMHLFQITHLEFIISGLAVYRLALLLSSDVGPYGIFSKLRSLLKREAAHNKPLRQSKIHLGIACNRCASIWIAAPVAVFAMMASRLPEWLAFAGWTFLLLNALSAIAILVGRALPPTT